MLNTHVAYRVPTKPFVKVLLLDSLATWKISGIKQHLSQLKHVTHFMLEKHTYKWHKKNNRSLPYCWINLILENNHQTTKQNKVHWHPPPKKCPTPPQKKKNTSPFLDVPSQEPTRGGGWPWSPIMVRLVFWSDFTLVVLVTGISRRCPVGRWVG